MTLLFLDIDGVLNAWPVRDSDSQLPPVIAKIHPRCVVALNRIWAAVDPSPKIVIISSWRFVVLNGHMDAHAFGYMLRTHGVCGEVLDVTPDGMSRAEEIRAWLKQYREAHSIERYVVIDDDHVEIEPFILCNASTGLTFADADRVIEILKGNP